MQDFDIARLTRTSTFIGGGCLTNQSAGTVVRIVGSNNTGSPAMTFLVETMGGLHGAEVCPSYLTPA